MTKSRNIIASRKQWSNEEDRIIAEHYPVTSSTELAELLGCKVHVLYKRAERLGVKKAPGFMSSFISGRFQRGERRSPETAFKPGQKPWSFGKKIGTRGRSGETQFKKGTVPHNYVPVGTEKINVHGYVLVKISDSGTQWERWAFKHRLTWEQAHGPIPDGYLVNFKDSNRKNCALENLELVTRAEHASRHGINTYPKELRELMQLRGAITRQINKKEKEHEQNA